MSEEFKKKQSRNPRPKLRANRKVERAGVNEVRALFEEVGWIFQEVDLANDYGKDAYVDAGEPGDLVSGLCIALQIKSGESFRTSTGYNLPLKPEHVTVWRESSLPVAAVVFDPVDTRMRWTNVSRFLQDQNSDSTPTTLPIRSDDFLDRETIPRAFRRSLQDIVRSDGAARALLGLYDECEARQVSSLFDCLGYGRGNAQILTAIRHSSRVLSPRAFAIMIEGLGSLAVWNANVLYSSDTAPSARLIEAMRPHLNWSVDELVRIIETVEVEAWDRSGLGFQAFVLMEADPDLANKLGEVLRVFLEHGDESYANIALGIALELENDDQPAVLDRLVRAIPAITRTWFFSEVQQSIEDHGFVAFW